MLYCHALLINNLIFGGSSSSEEQVDFGAWLSVKTLNIFLHDSTSVGTPLDDAYRNVIEGKDLNLLPITEAASSINLFKPSEGKVYRHGQEFLNSILESKAKLKKISERKLPDKPLIDPKAPQHAEDDLSLEDLQVALQRVRESMACSESESNKSSSESSSDW